MGVRENQYGPVFGHGALWVGAWWAVPSMLNEVRTNRPNGVKYPSFTIRDGKVTNSLGPPRVKVKRLDGKGETAGDTGGYATTQNDSGQTLHWWPTGANFSSKGCWQVTETVGQTSIAYVVEI